MFHNFSNSQIPADGLLFLQDSTKINLVNSNSFVYTKTFENMLIMFPG